LPNAVPKPKRRRRKPKPLTRSQRMKNRGPRTRKSGGAMFPQWIDEKFREYVRGLPCVLLGRMPVEPGLWALHQCPTAATCRQACHVKSRGSGGVDHANLYPACWVMHDEQHRLGLRSFEKRWGVDLRKIAEQLYAQYQAGVGAGAPGTPE
jgi:hypothetical protein